MNIAKLIHESNKTEKLLIQEQNLLVMIAKITNEETANKAKDLCDSKKHSYKFDTYLYWLNELYQLLLRGIPSDKALDLIDGCLESKSNAALYKMLINNL